MGLIRMKNNNSNSKQGKIDGENERKVPETDSKAGPSHYQEGNLEEQNYLWAGKIDKIAKVSLVNLDSDGSLSSAYSACSKKSSKDNKNRNKSGKRKNITLAHMNRAKAREEDVAKRRGIREIDNCSDTELEDEGKSQANEEEQANESQTVKGYVLSEKEKEFPPLGEKTGFSKQQLLSGNLSSGEGNLEEDNILPELPKIEEKRKQGRPVTTGEYEVLKLKRARKKEEEEKQREKEILDSQFPPAQGKSYKDFLRRIEDKEEEYHQTSIQDLEAITAEKAMDIFKVAISSGQLKGTYVKRAKEAAADMVAAATELAIRAQNPSQVPITKQLEELRQQIYLLKMENTQLREKVEKLSKRKAHTTHPDNNCIQVIQSDSREVRKARTSKWVEGSPLPSMDGEFPTAQGRIGETPLPPRGGGVSPIQEVEMNETTHPPEDGEVPLISSIIRRVRKEREEEEREKRGITEDEEMPLWYTSPTNQMEGNKNPSGIIKIQKGNHEQVIPQTPEEGNVREKKLALIAKFEGIVVRMLDERFVCQIPTYGERKRKEKELGLQQKHQQPMQPRTKISSTMPVSREKTMVRNEDEDGNGCKKPTIRKIEVIERMVKVKPKSNTATATTLNPPARNATNRIQTKKNPKVTNKEREGKPAPLNTQNKKGSSNVSRAQEEVENSWAQVVSKRDKKKAASATKKQTQMAEKSKQRKTNPAYLSVKESRGEQQQVKRKEPKTAAVTITCPPGKYEETLREARQKN